MESGKRLKKGFVDEEDVSTILQRYSAAKVLSLLQEVDQAVSAAAGGKIDWNAVVKKTATGITNAREYQMVWRHIAYRSPMLDKVDDGAEPMDDDSDIEYELEAFPAASPEDTIEVAACVKVMSASGLPSDPTALKNSTVRAPSTLNISNSHSLKSSMENHRAASAMHGSSVAVAVSGQKQQTLQVSSGQKQSFPGVEGSDANGSSKSNNPPPKRKRKWTKEEDATLEAAVQKCGEGNWMNIVNEYFKEDNRTTSQLAQRWGFIRKRQNISNIVPNTNGSQLSEVQLAARRALHMALKDNVMTVGNVTAGAGNSSTVKTSNENSSMNNQASQPQQLQSLSVSVNTTGTSFAVPKPRAPPKKPAPKPIATSESSMVTAVAMAAGARIASPSDAASLFKAAQANNAIHIKSSVGSNLKPFSSTHLGPDRNVQLNHPSIGSTTSSASRSTVSLSHTSGSQPARSNFVRPTVPSATQKAPKASTSYTLSNNSNSILLSQSSKAPTIPTILAAVHTISPSNTSPNGPPVHNQNSGEENETPPLLGTVKTETVETKINAAPVLSSSNIVVTKSEVVAAEKS